MAEAVRSRGKEQRKPDSLGEEKEGFGCEFPKVGRRGGGSSLLLPGVWRKQRRDPRLHGLGVCVCVWGAYVAFPVVWFALEYIYTHAHLKSSLGTSFDAVGSITPKDNGVLGNPPQGRSWKTFRQDPCLPPPPPPRQRVFPTLAPIPRLPQYFLGFSGLPSTRAFLFCFGGQILC